MKPKFVIGIGVIVAAMIVVMVLSIAANSSTEVMVNDLIARRERGETGNRSYKITGIVVGDSIVYNPATLDLQFDMVNSREDLHNNLATAPRVRVVHKGIRPDTLVNEATAIATGKFDGNGNFVLNDSPDALLLQCPTKYEDAAKAQAGR